MCTWFEEREDRLEQDAIMWFADCRMGMQEYREFDQYPEYEQQDDIGRVFLFKYANHGYRTAGAGLVIIYFRKANIITVLTGNDHLAGTYLFCVFWHEFIPFIQVFQRRITRKFPTRGQAVIIQQNSSFLILIEQEMQQPAGIHHLIG